MAQVDDPAVQRIIRARLGLREALVELDDALRAAGTIGCAICDQDDDDPTHDCGHRGIVISWVAAWEADYMDGKGYGAADCGDPSGHVTFGSRAHGLGHLIVKHYGP